MASSMAIKTLAASPLTRSPLTKSLSSLVRLVSFSTKSDDDDAIPTAGISRPLADILKELNKKVPDSLVRLRTEDGFNIKYIPWHIVNRIMNLHAPEWSGEVRNITYSADGKSVSVVYRVTLYGTDAEVSDLFYDSRYDMHPVNLCLLVHMHASSLILLLSCFPNASYVVIFLFKFFFILPEFSEHGLPGFVVDKDGKISRLILSCFMTNSNGASSIILLIILSSNRMLTIFFSILFLYCSFAITI
ncbi:hypothetical protein J1N35_014239 [Gossypium stocksii]|uniref:Uncharacterized protein n=1 Tax=Gossypium stocksii TaxID=47602 RepID=A0A9D3VV63_9ROSI|nr:hypothetical protein J1N35_014239 [Gossypium stocksii]